MSMSPARAGFVAGLSFLAALSVLHWIFDDSHTDAPAPVDPRESYIQEQLWHLFAEVRRITEESA